MIVPSRFTIQNPRSNESRWLLTTLVDYLKHSQIHGYKIILSKERPYIDRGMWTMLALLDIVFTVWLIVTAYVHLQNTPTVTSQDANQLPIQQVAFPAIVFCSENRISRRSLLDYSEFMWVILQYAILKLLTNFFYSLNATQNLRVNIGRTVEQVFDNLLSIGKMYDLRMDENDFYKFDQVHSVLVQVYGDGGVYPLAEILSAVTWHRLFRIFCF